MTWLEEVQEWLNGSWGVNMDLAWRIAVLASWASYYNIPISMVSGFRDPERTRELQALWDSGQRAGLKVRPVTGSKHSVETFWGNPDALAVDLGAGSDANLRILGNWATTYLGLNWGGNFRDYDPGHFYV